MTTRFGVPALRVFAVFGALLLTSSSLLAATFVVPDDREMVRRADIIVLATAGASISQLNNDGGIETVTPMSVSDVLKGSGVPSTLNVYEPGGHIGNMFTVIPGSPRFADGEQLLLFLKQTDGDRWAVAELVLGKFAFHDNRGEKVLTRDADEIVGWDPDLRPHTEHARDAERFLRFVRSEAAGVRADEDYFVSAPLTAASTSSSPALTPGTNIAPYTATSYTMIISGSMGSRWTQFPGSVTFFSGTTQEPGAPGGGTTAINAAFTSWDNDCGSNVNYVYGGTSTATAGLHSPDGVNEILFEQDLSSWGIAPFSCSANGYSGTLGIGGITNASGTINTVNGESFATTLEADVMMNKGLANCTLLFNSGDFNSAVTHEVGHTLGFRHADQTRSGSAACTTDPSLECATSAIMTAFVTQGINAALQPWDQHAVDAVYPGNICAPGGTCTPPSITGQPSGTTITQGGSVTLTVTASGTAPLSYQWYLGTSGSTGNPIPGATGSSLTVSPTSTTSYWVRVSNSCGSADSATATVTVTVPTITKKVRADFNGDGRSDIFWRNASTSQESIWFMNGTSISTAVISTNVPAPWTPAAFGDFDGDGKADVLWFNTSTGQTSLWLGWNGSTFATQVSSTTVPASWRVFSGGDIDGDGRSDLFWYNPSTGQTSIWFMNGTSVTAVSSTTVPTTWVPKVFGDFDGDGKSDILWFNTSTGETSIWLGWNGSTFATQVRSITVPTTWSPVGSGDFNGDGKDDIYWFNAGTGETSMWLMNGSSVGSTLRTTTVPTVWHPEWFGDFDGNGKADIFWRNTSTGETSIWLGFNGSSFTTQVRALTAPLSWVPAPSP